MSVSRPHRRTPDSSRSLGFVVSALRGKWLVIGRSTIIVAGGAAAGQVIALAATPWLTRSYGPGEFGVYAAFAALCSVFLTVGCLRYDVAINAATDGELRPALFAALSACVAAAVVFSLAVVLPIGGAALRRLVGDAATAPRIFAAVLLCGGYQMATAFLVREGKFTGSALLRLLQPLVFVVAALLLPWGLIDSHLLGFFAAAPVIALAALGGRLPALSEILESIRRHRDFALVSLPTSLLDSLSVALPVWFIAANYGADDTGQYSMAQRLLAAPAVIIAMAAGQVFLKRAGDLVRSGQSPRPLLRRSAGQLGVAAAGLLVAVVLVGSPLLSLILGAGWRTDLSFLLLALVPALIRSVVSPVTGVFIVRGRLRSAAVWQVAYFVGTGLLFLVLAGRVSLEVLLLAFCVSEALFYTWYLRLADRVAD